jgi:hypothetical protein
MGTTQSTWSSNSIKLIQPNDASTPSSGIPFLRILTPNNRILARVLTLVLSGQNEVAAELFCGDLRLDALYAAFQALVTSAPNPLSIEVWTNSLPHHKHFTHV